MPHPIRHISTTLLLLTATATAACQGTTPPSSAATTPPPAAVLPEATAEQKDLAILTYAQLRQLEAVGNHCDWLGPVEQTAVTAAQDERLAWLKWQQLDTDAAEAKAAELIGKFKDLDCKSEDGEQHRLGLTVTAWQLRSSWALRGESMLPGPSRPAWFEGKSNVTQHRASLEQAVVGMKEVDADSTEASQAMFLKETASLLPVRCKISDSDCPAANPDPAFQHYAEKVIELTETYAQALSQTEDKTGKPKQQ